MKNLLIQLIAFALASLIVGFIFWIIFNKGIVPAFNLSSHLSYWAACSLALGVLYLKSYIKNIVKG